MMLPESITQKKILIIEPYYGGSHRHFLEGIMQHVEACYTLLQLPARKWKMRMQLSAPWFVEKIKKMAVGERWFDLVLCSTLTDVAVFRALVSRVDGWNPDILFYSYFHENQFAYPGYLPKRSQHQFTAINYTTALASDHIAFNSRYNRDTFIRQIRKYLGKAVDMRMDETVAAIEAKSVILYPGLDFGAIDKIKQHRNNTDSGVPVIVWNHRWEHDKNPEEFFTACCRLKDDGFVFKLIVMGQRFRECPSCFPAAGEMMQDRLIQFGFIEKKQDYYQMLARGSYIISTAFHEFFGIAVLEAVRAGCYPVLPDRLSYGELYGEEFLYGEGCLYERMKEVLTEKPVFTREQSFQLTEKFNWESLSADYKRWLYRQQLP